ncbi:MAG: polysaccharide deacetylase family protein [Lentimicrobiaceae bacterium]|nr:polysaccharide deacetylase family protein [Lentimicrobiaceae bacterium]
MRSICLYFQVHQPFRLRTYRFFDIGRDHYYYDDYLNRSITQRVARRCYLPANHIVMDLIKEYGSAFNVSYSITGLALEQFEKYAPEVIESFQKLAKTGSVEFLTETYAHSLASLASKEEFFRQVQEHSDKIHTLFGQRPKVFRNTELIYSDRVGELVAEMGYELMLTEGPRQILGWKSPNFMYCNSVNPRLKLLLKNFRLSDDIAFRFSLQSWNEWPLTAEKFASWVQAFNPKEEVVNIFLDYETFGEHQWADSGIFDFLRNLPRTILSDTDYSFHTPGELLTLLQPVSAIHVGHAISWADEERDTTAWLGNEMQNEAVSKLYSLGNKIKAIHHEDIKRDWYYLQSSDHFYYMCTKWFSDGEVHKYFTPYSSPYEAFINYMNVLSDFMIRVDNLYKVYLETVPVVENTREVKRKAAKPARAASAEKACTFEDMNKLSASNLKKLLKQVDLETLACALIHCDVSLRENLIKVLSPADRVRFEAFSYSMAKSKKTEINKCRQKLAAVLSDLL